MGRRSFTRGPAAPRQRQDDKTEAVKHLALVARRWLKDRASTADLDEAIGLWDDANAKRAAPAPSIPESPGAGGGDRTGARPPHRGCGICTGTGSAWRCTTHLVNDLEEGARRLAPRPKRCACGGGPPLVLVPICPACGAQWIGRTEAAALDAARTNAPEGETPHFFDKRAADALANEVAKLIDRRVIDSRSPAADALLDYRDGWDRAALGQPARPEVEGLPEETLAELERRHAAASLRGEAEPQWTARAAFTVTVLQHLPALLADYRRLRARGAAGGGTDERTAADPDAVCANCSHTRSYHRGGNCADWQYRAYTCKCERFVEPATPAAPHDWQYDAGGLYRVCSRCAVYEINSKSQECPAAEPENGGTKP